ncbi:Abi family protein [Segatella hominis]|uniref:Abi family protein n=1 Tax=Segatella hominis TaxID=2518605 RepID=UPI003F814D45
MEITDEEKAQHYLSHIGYYRLSAYMYPLLSIPKEQHLFKQGVTIKSEKVVISLQRVKRFI